MSGDPDRSQVLPGYGETTGLGQYKFTAPQSMTATESVNGGSRSAEGVGVPMEVQEIRLEEFPVLIGIIDTARTGQISRATAIRSGVTFIDLLEEKSLQTKDRIVDSFMAALDEVAMAPSQTVVLQSLKRKGLVDGEDGYGDEARDYRVNKKTKIRECDMPWYDAEKMRNLCPSMKKTRNIIEYIRQDVETAKRWVQSAPGAPANFPPSEWEAILRGEAVNLEAVFQTLHFPRSERRDYKPYYAEYRDERQIETSSDWIVAWKKTMEATLFVFPHRDRELRAYEAYIMKWFETTRDDMEEHIFLFDEAIRGRVRGGESMSLSETENFEDLVEAILRPCGIYYEELKAGQLDDDSDYDSRERRRN